MNKKIIMYGVVAVVLIVIGGLGLYMGLREFRKQKLNNEYQNKTSEVEIVFYHVHWCPYCKTAEPIWDKVTKKYNGEETNLGKNMVFRKLDCDENEFVVNGKVVNSYPTIYANNFKDEQVEFDSKCTEDSLRMFIEEIKSNN